MGRSPGQLVILWLAAIGLLFQGLIAGRSPGGVLLCVGCEDGGWSVVAPGHGAAPDEACCDDEPIDSPRPAPDGVGKGGGCGCVGVPLEGGPAAPASLTRLDLGGAGCHALAPPGLAPSTQPVEAAPARARAGPRAPARPLDPLARRTVLIL